MKPTFTLLAAVSLALVATTAAQAQTPAAIQSMKVIGQPIGSDRIELQPNGNPNIKLTIAINNDKDRVGALVSVCQDANAVSESAIENNDCDDIAYVFPSLRYDEATKKVYLGDTLIASDRGFWRGGLQLEEGYELQYKSVTRAQDLGFDRASVQVLEVSLIKKADQPQGGKYR